jgi:predicted DCC family thiol-disulfide oxidoreductase YuxK
MLFDGLCPICRREVAWLQRRDKDGRISFEDFTDPAFDFASLNISIDTLNATMHAVLSDGSVVHGMDALRAFYSAVGYGRWVAPTGWPVIRYLFDGFYWVWAKLRVKHGTCTDTTCG